jgi:deoxyribose-phosphate aldolase
VEDILNILALADRYIDELPPLPQPLEPPQGSQIASWIDHTLLEPQATSYQVKELCQEADQFGFASVCVNPVYTSLAAGLLRESPVKVCCMAGFPLGASLPATKVIEALTALNAGAAEIDMVINIGALKSQAYGLVINEVQFMAQTVHNQRADLTATLEAALLTRREKIIACLLCKAAGADFVKTSTGFGSNAAGPEEVELMRRVVGPEMGIKAGGDIQTYQEALAVIRAGASRVGASAGVAIVRDAETFREVEA